jgi:hypothetical protein
MYGKVSDFIHGLKDISVLRRRSLSYFFQSEKFKIGYKEHLNDLVNDPNIANSGKIFRIVHFLDKMLSLCSSGSGVCSDNL